MTELAQNWPADDVDAAQDAINEIIGREHSCNEGFYRQRVAHIALSVSPDAARAARQQRLDHARVERLRYLKETLYTDPSLMAIEHLDRHPEINPADFRIEDFRKFADNLRATEEWWSPLMVAWHDLAEKITSKEEIDITMRVLLDAILKLDVRLAQVHGLPKKEDH